jgi:hypothetical protein
VTIAELVDLEVMRHLSLFGCIKNADPMVQHLVKTSADPLMQFRRHWMRMEALRQVQEATANQEKLNKTVARAPIRRGSSARLNASIDPWFVGEMRHRHKTEWQDPDFLKSVRRDEPAIFPKREA